MPVDLQASELEPVLSEHVNDLPESVVRSLSSNPLGVADAGPNQLEPPDVLSRMAFAAVTRAAWGVRSDWLDSLE